MGTGHGSRVLQEALGVAAKFAEPLSYQDHVKRSHDVYARKSVHQGNIGIDQVREGTLPAEWWLD